MKAPKNRPKLLRVNCANCKAQQDSLSSECSHCKGPLYGNMTEEELIPVRDAIDSLELVLNRIEQGQSPRQDPYSDHDLALKQIRDLKRHQFIPGMSAYLAACKKVLLPFRIGLMEKTLRANLVFCLVLLGFAAAPMLLKWPSSVTFLMCLPAAVWIFVTLKAYAGLRAAISEMKE